MQTIINILILFLVSLVSSSAFQLSQIGRSNRFILKNSEEDIVSFEEIELFAKKNGILLKAEEKSISLTINAFAIGDEENRIGYVSLCTILLCLSPQLFSILL